MFLGVVGHAATSSESFPGEALADGGDPRFASRIRYQPVVFFVVVGVRTAIVGES